LYLNNPESQEAINECKRLADLMHNMGALAIRDPRVTFDDSNSFLDILESYFERPQELLLKDARPEIHYQIGVTPEGTELPRCTSDPRCQQLVQDFPLEDRPQMPVGPDAKWRYFHRIGERPDSTRFDDLNCEPVIPDGFPNWTRVLDTWGSKLVASAFTTAEMLAVGLNLPKDSFTKLMRNGPHLLAPTASDLKKHGLGTILAGFHQDLNLMTFHGKSRFSGLSIWLRNGKKFPVSIPSGCLLCQAGMQLERLTGGYINAGYHEVVVTQSTVFQVEKARDEGRSQWRISSTLFSHVASDNILSVLYGDEDEIRVAKEKYPDISAGDQVQKELEYIKLAKSNN
jgi:isopenicillin N synthase-like dioxygenase